MNIPQALWDFLFWETVTSKTNILILSSWSLESTEGNRNETINHPNKVRGKVLFIKIRKSGEGGVSLMERLHFFTEVP